MNNSANRERPKGDEYILDKINPVPRRKNLPYIRYLGVKYYQTPYAGYYISKTANILSLRQNKYHILKVYPQPTKYVKAAIRINNKKHGLSVHKLMMETFYGKRPEGYSIDHIDCDPSNNCLNNLRYLTMRDNTRRACSGKNRPGRKVIAMINGGNKVYNSLTEFLNDTQFSIASWRKLKRGIYPKAIKSRYIVKKFSQRKNGYYINMELNPNRQRKFLGRIFM